MKLEYTAQVLRGWPKQGARERTEIVTNGVNVVNGDWVEMQANGTVNKSSIASTRKAGLVVRGDGDSASAANASGPLMTPQPAITVTGITWVGGFLTITATAHGYSVGNTVTIAGATTTAVNGTYTVETTADANTFTVVLATDPGVITVGSATATLISGTSSQGEALVLWGNFIVATTNYDTADEVYAPGNPLTVKNGKLSKANGVASGPITTTALTWATGVVTVTTATAHGFSIGQRVTIAGVTAAGYNGTFVITSVADTTHFTYALAANPGTATVQGTATTLVDPEVGFVLRVQGATATESAHLVAVIF